MQNKPEPIYTYFWVAKLKDEKTIVPQFDLKSGVENKWKDVCIDQISKLSWYPFSDEFATLVGRANNILVLATNNPLLSINVPDGATPVIFRRGYLSQYSYYHCTICGKEFYWNGENALECPNCASRNEWYCKICKRIIEDPLLFKNGEARCPECEKNKEPNGLNRLKTLEYATGVNHEVHYCLGIDGEEVRIWNDRGEKVE